MRSKKTPLVQRRQKLVLEIFEPRNLLTSVPFAEAVVLGPEDRSVTMFSTSLTDLDSDGDLDILTRKKSGSDPFFLSWYLNTGDGTFAASHRDPDTTGLNPIGAFWLADIEGDGDADIIRSNPSDYSLTENRLSEGGSLESAEGQTFRLSSRIVDVADVNGDGMDDFLTFDGWAENLGDSFREHELDGLTTRSPPLVTDIDSDGDLDLVRQTGRAHLTIHRNVGGENVFASAEVTDWNFGKAELSFPFDVDHDGDEDLFLMNLSPSVEDGEFSWATLGWIENSNGSFESGVVRRFTDNTSPYPVGVFMQFDATGDGQPDLIFESKSGTYGRFDNLQDSPWVEVDIPKFHSGLTGDLDGDSDLDWLGTTFIGDLRWFDGIGAGATEHVVAESVPPRINDLTAVDFDNDGDVDLLYTRGSQLSWFENLDNQSFAKEQVALEISGSPLSLLVSDVTGDGLPDVAYSATDEAGASVNVWHRNLGDADLGDALPLPDAFGFAFLDLDGDGDQDLHSRTVQGNIVRLNDGGGVFGTDVPVPGDELTATDVDQDGDLDLVSSRPGEVAWFENLGNSSFGPGTIIATGDINDSMLQTLVFDADADGDSDVIVVRSPQVRESTQLNQVFENQGGQFALASEFDGGQSFPFGAIRVVDLDKDGDADLVGSGSLGQAFIENKGKLQFERPQSLAMASGRSAYLSFVASDFDGDGSVDLAADRGDQVVWHRNMLEELGPVVTHVDVDRVFEAIREGDTDEKNDWNNDDAVNQADVDFLLVEVFDTRRGDVDLDGKIGFADFLLLSANFGEQDAGWQDGDVDGDGIVGFADFLLLSAVFGSGE